MNTNKIHGHAENNDVDGSQVEPQPQSVHAVENQPGPNDPHYVHRWARIVEVLTLIVISLGVLAAYSTLKSINESVKEAGRSADAAEKAAIAATSAASATERQVEIAGQQMEIAKQQIGDARDALRLDQRAWLGYERYVIQARANNTSGWEEREPRAGEQFSGRFYFQNVGRTPALKCSRYERPTHSD